MENHKISVLMVEDDPILRYSLTELLSYHGYKVHGAQDGLAALQQLEGVQPDILLSDLNMPRMDGYELLSIVRSRYPAIRVVAMSGAYTGEKIPDGVAADAFYPKACGGYALLIKILARIASRQFSPARRGQEKFLRTNGGVAVSGHKANRDAIGETRDDNVRG